MSSIRITTGGVFRTYGSNLTKSYKQLNDSMVRVQKEREFNAYAEDPAAGSTAFKLRRSIWRTNNQVNNSSYASGKFQVAWSAMHSVVDGDADHQDLSGMMSALTALNGTNSEESRTLLGQDLMERAKSIVLTMNSQYGDEYVFSGNDGLNPPFTWDEDDSTTLLYRGIEVNTTDEDELASLQSMTEERSYIDIGLGMKLKNGTTELDSATAFDSALSGLSFLGGFGVDEDGDPKNLAALLMKVGEYFTTPEEDYDQSRARALVGKLQEAVGLASEAHTQLDAKSSYLKINQDQLLNSRDSMTEQLDDVEGIDPALAISEMLWAQYSYNAALRVGNNILSQSLLDYMS